MPSALVVVDVQPGVRRYGLLGAAQQPRLPEVLIAKHTNACPGDRDEPHGGFATVASTAQVVRRSAG
jgi:hypothetical protein